MLNIKEITKAVEQIAEEKGLEAENVMGVVEDALAAAYKKEYVEKGSIIRAKMDSKSGDLKFWRIKEVVDPEEVRIVEEEEEDVETEGPKNQEAKEQEEGSKENERDSSQAQNDDAEEEDENEESEESEESEDEEYDEDDPRPRYNSARHIFIDEAKEVDPDAEVGGEVVFPLEEKEDFGRIAAQVAKQTIIQKVREAERGSILDEWRDKEGEIVSGLVQRVERGHVYIDFGRAVGVMFANESIPGEHYTQGERLRFLVLAVQEDSRLPGIILTRAHPDFVRQLFEMEVPEISDGVVEIRDVAREAGSRTKIAVSSNDESVDPIGACVGQRGTRVMAVNNEIGQEKIDIIEWSDEPEQYVAHSLSPAEVEAVEMMPRRTVRVYVPEDQLSLAIGRGGQNVRMAAKLTGWKIDVRSQTRPDEELEGGVAEFPQDEEAITDEPMNQEAKEQEEVGASEPEEQGVEEETSTDEPKNENAEEQESDEVEGPNSQEAKEQNEAEEAKSEDADDQEEADEANEDNKEDEESKK